MSFGVSASTHNFKSMDELLGDTRRTRQDNRRATTQQQDICRTCAKRNRKSTARTNFWPNCHDAPWGHESLTSSSGTCGHSPSSLIGMCERIAALAGLQLVSCFLHGLEQVEHLYTEHLWHMWKSLEISWRIICCLQHCPAWLVWQWGSYFQ